MKRLLEISRKRSRVVVGLMSGTSHDGVDAVLARITGSGARSRAEVLAHSRSPYPKRLREKVSEAFDGPTGLVCRLNFELGEFFADAALRAMKAAGMSPAEVDVIGSHGQTIYHDPPGPGKRRGSTLQIAEGAVIARRTGVVTVSDFRTADMAVGGEGAPLVPLADWILFGRPGEVTAIQNIGGIANVTVLPDSLDGVMGFDTGPGCSLLDETVRITSSGKLDFDKGGKLAKSGKIIPELLFDLLSNPYFKRKPPKSTGREAFGRGMAERLVSAYGGSRGTDILCTLTHLTARSIRKAYEDFVLPRHGVDRIILAGGGARNAFLVTLLRELFDGIPIKGMEEFGIPSQAREALCFAVLANETVSGNPGNLPAVTGARERVALGKINL